MKVVIHSWMNDFFFFFNALFILLWLAYLPFQFSVDDADLKIKLTLTHTSSTTYFMFKGRHTYFPALYTSAVSNRLIPFSYAIVIRSSATFKSKI